MQPEPRRTAIVGGTLPRGTAGEPGTLLLEGETITAVLPAAERAGAGAPLTAGAWSAQPGDAIVDATGLVVMPGAIDLHTHLGEPGDERAETFRTGTRGAICGGTTTVFEHPLSDPPTTTTERYAAKRALVERGTWCDVGLWGAVAPQSLDEMQGQAALGALGFKAFTCSSGGPFPASDPATLDAGMREAARLNRLVLVHCELPDQFRPISSGPLNAARFRASRPPAAEVAAVELVLNIAGRTGCRVQIVHVSSPASVDLILGAQAAGVAATFEHTAHHLLLGAADADRLSGLAHCAPPVRDELVREGLWDRLAAGAPAILASDHVPSTAARRAAADLRDVPLGIASIGETPALVVDEAVHRRGLGLEATAELLAGRAADAVGLADRGRIAAGMRADLALWDLTSPRVFDPARDQRTRHRWSPYAGRTLRARAVQVYRAGRLASRDSSPVGLPAGTFVPGRAGG